MAEKKSTTSKNTAKKKNAAAKSGRPSAAKRAASANTDTSVPIRGICAGVCLLLAVLSLFGCFAAQGFILSALKNVLCGLLGTTGFYLMPVVLFYLFFLLAFQRKRPVWSRCLSAVLFVIAAGAVSHLLASKPDLPSGIQLVGGLYQSGIAGESGGVLGGLVAITFELALSRILAIIVLCILGLIALLASLDVTIGSIIRAIENRPRPDFEEPERQRDDPATVVVNHFAYKHIAHLERKKRAAEYDVPLDEEPAAPLPRPAKKERLRKAAVQSPDEFLESQLSVRPPEEKLPIEVFDGEPITGDTVIPPAPVKESVLEQAEPEAELEAPVDAVSPEPQEQLHDGWEEAVIQSVGAVPAPAESAAPDPLGKVSAQEARQSAQEVAQEIASGEQEPKPEYRIPAVGLLKAPSGAVADGTSEMRENTKRLNEALQSFKIEAKICNVTRGPSVTRYEVELAQGVRLAKITALQDDIALALGATGVRISAIPEKIAVVGIEVPNKLVTTVALREVIDSPQFIRAKSKSSFAVGKDIGGACVVGDISKLPHMLIAGTTGSGKSVCMNSIIISLLYKAMPDEVKLIMVDPKMVELGIYNGIPHLLIPVVTDPKKAAGALQWAVTEMMRRYRTMSDAGVRDLESYNHIVEHSDEGERLAQIVVIIDELADLMLVAAKEVEESICRIAQMGRAAGMHLIIATQRPSADVITGLMKANIPSRIAFAVSSAMESRIILDTQGAEKLVGQGDMLYAPLGKGKPRRIQGCYVSDREVEAVTDFVKNQADPSYSQEVMEEIERKAEQSGKGGKVDPGSELSNAASEGDELLPAAVDVILETGQASVSMLQRRLKLGYARAARIVDEMEEKGIVGPFVGSKPRSILISKEQWQQMQSGQMTLEEPEWSEPVPEDIP